MSRLSPANVEIAHEIIGRFPRRKSATIPLLHLAQEQDGYVTQDAMVHIAELVGTTAADVYGTASFYEMFKFQPVGRYCINVCVTLSCMLRGSDELFEHIADYLGLDGEGTTADGMFTLAKVQCIGACDRAPCLQVDSGVQLGPLEPADATCLIDDLRAEPAPTRYDR